MEPGDVLGMFTDGITETTGAQGKEFGEARLLEVLAQSRGLESNAMLSEVENAVREFRSSEQLQDDLSLVIARGR
jgi:sigma-B regulation protein RsbU (phosphoserine phosphatase)